MSEVETGVFGFTDRTLDWVSVGWATSQVDLMGQGIVQFHLILPDGYGTNTYGWHSILYLRNNVISNQIEYLIEQDGEWGIEQTWDWDDDMGEMIFEAGLDKDAERLLVLLLRVASPRLEIRAVTAADLEWEAEIPFIDEPELEALLQERGREDRLISLLSPSGSRTDRLRLLTEPDVG